MTSKFAIKSILGVSLVLMVSIVIPTASAIVSSTTVSGCTPTKKLLGQCSIFVDGLLKGLGNVSNNPTAFTATLSKMSGVIFCKNPANNALSNGQPFTETEIPLTGGDAIEPRQVTKNGKALSEIVFHDVDIIEAIKRGTQVPDCQNSNWIQLVVVTRMEVMGQQLEDPSPTSTDPDTCLLTGATLDIDGCVVTDTLRTSCRIQDPYFLNPASAVGNSYNYGNEQTGTGSCTEICHSTDSSECNLALPAHSYP